MAQKHEMVRIIDAISRDRNVDKESLYVDIEQAMVSAARKHFNAEDVEEFSCTVDRLNGEIKIYRGEELIPLEALGRIPAQTAKQVMIQKFREDERASIFDEFTQRVGELVTGTAQRYEGGSLVIQVGRAEGFMPRSEQISGEQHMPGERIRCMILDVRDVGSQVKIILTRSNQEFIRRLFEVEVPEVSERIIEIKALAREPGHRTKIAVSSIDSKVDAVGACVGVRGSRIKNIVDELGGEKIDVVRWNESSQVLIANSLRPAEIVEISLCFELGRATVVVNEDQLSLAIGKRGQNVRLAARLTGWDVDILTPAEFQKGLDFMEEALNSVEGISEQIVDRMAALGFITVFDLEEIGPEVLVEHLSEFGMTLDVAEQAVNSASEKAKVVSELQAKERAEAEQRKAEQGEQDESLSDADEQAAAILGDLGAVSSDDKPAAESSEGEDSGGDIVDMLVSHHQTASTDTHDVDLAKENGQTDKNANGSSPAEQEIDLAQDETDIAKLAQGEDEDFVVDESQESDAKDASKTGQESDSEDSLT